MPSENYQTFYTRPHSPPRFFFISIGLMAIALLSGDLSAIAWIFRPFALGWILILCVFATVFDPETVFTTRRRVGGDGEGNGKDGRSDGARVIKVERPLAGFKHLEYRVETPEHWGDVWEDGVRHEEAYFRVG